MTKRERGECVSEREREKETKKNGRVCVRERGESVYVCVRERGV